MDTLEMKGNWHITKAKPTNDDLQLAEGKREELLGRIQKRTGETREAVARAIEDSCSTSCCSA